MSRKNGDNQVITKKNLEKTLDKALASRGKVILNEVDQKFEKVGERFDEVDQKFEKAGERFDEVDQKFEKADEQIKEKFDKVLTGQDKICKQLSDLTQESKINTKLYKYHDKKLEKHEQRINKLELNIQPAKHA